MMNDIEQVREGWRKKAQKVAREVVAPRAAKIDEEGEFPWDIAKVFHEEGFLSLVIPKEYGGMDGDITSLCVVSEEIAKFCASSSLLVIVQAVGTMPVALGGTEEMKKQFLGEIAREKKLIAFCITEPDSGSDAASIRTKATREEGHYLINGRKCFITNGGVADLYTVFAVTQPDKKMEGITGFLLEKGTPGLSIGKVEEKMGIRGSNTTEVLLEDVRASLPQRIGDEGVGWWLMMRTLNRSRPAIGAQAVGLAQGAVDTAVKFGQEKNWFRQRDDAVLIEAKLSDMIIEIEAAKALVYKAANMMDEKTKGVPVQMFSAMSKYFASDVAMKVTTDVVQLMEWQGLARDYPAERMMRDAKVIQIFEGTNQIQRMVVAHTLLKGK